MTMSKQCKLVLDHISTLGYITQLVATNYGVTRLASRIHDLKLAGYTINAETHRDMTGKRYTRYSLDMAESNVALLRAA